MADMLVKLYNIPHSHDIEENLFKSGIRIKKALAPDRSRIIAFLILIKLRTLFLIIPLPVILQQGKRKSSVSHVMRRQPGIFSALWLCWKVKEKRVWGKPYC